MQSLKQGSTLAFPLLALLFLFTLLASALEAPGQSVVIVLDPGHGGQDVGVVGPGGLTEKEVCLDLAKRVKQRIAKHLGYQTFLTRSQDEKVSLTERASLANNYQGTLYVSIHLAGFPDQSISGFSFFNHDASHLEALPGEERGHSLPFWDAQQRLHGDDSRRLTDTFHQLFLQRFPSQRDLGWHTLPLYPFGAFNMPAVLIEPAVLTNPVQEDLLQKEGFREEISEAIFQGIRLFVKPDASGGTDE